MRDEQVRPPLGVDVDLEAGAVGMQVEMLAFVQIERQQVETRPAAAIGRLLEARRDAQARAALADQVGEKIAGRRRRPEGERCADQEQAAEKPVLRRRDDFGWNESVRERPRYSNMKAMPEFERGEFRS
ncbi:MAG TPA: hypothetical protein VFI80_03600 [Burkholderiales bacterium]|nr:hypothetical protein [Burkholderiales bacterium]